MAPKPLGWEAIGDAGSIRVVGLRLASGQHVQEHRNAIPVAVIVTEGALHFSDGTHTGVVDAGGLSRVICSRPACCAVNFRLRRTDRVCSSPTGL